MFNVYDVTHQKGGQLSKTNTHNDFLTESIVEIRITRTSRINNEG